MSEEPRRLSEDRRIGDGMALILKTPRTASAKMQPVFIEQPLRRAQRRRKNDGLVTDANFARTQIPDAPLSRLREGPAYKLAV